jgi:cation diffusion facilitator family transporter
MNPRIKAAKKATVVNTSTNSFLAIFKIMIGYFGHSQALIADGIHSISDIATDLLVYIAAVAGGKHPDKEHPYGHQRIETIAAIIIAFVLLGVGASIIYEAITRVIHHAALLKPTYPVIIVAVFSVLANEWLFRYTLKLGKQANSQLIITNAWHNRSDVFVSIIVLISVVGSILGYKYLDAIGAAIVAVFILKMAIQMIWRSVAELIDTAADPDTIKLIQTKIAEIPGVQSIHELRTRLHGGNILVDVHIIVDPMISVSEGHYIGEQVNLHLKKTIEHVTDVIVHIDPEDDEKAIPCKDLPNRPTLEKNLHLAFKDLPHFNACQNIQLHYLNGQLIIDLFFDNTFTPDIEQLSVAYQQAAESLPNVKNVRVFIGK